MNMIFPQVGSLFGVDMILPELEVRWKLQSNELEGVFPFCLTLEAEYVELNQKLTKDTHNEQLSK